MDSWIPLDSLEGRIRSDPVIFMDLESVSTNPVFN